MKARTHRRLSGTALAAALFVAAASHRTHAQTAKTAQAVKCTGAITVDGALSEADWARAPAISEFSSFNRAKERFAEGTRVRVLFSDDRLYFGIDADESQPAWQEEDLAEAAGEFKYGLANVMELFLDTNHDRFSYDQFMVHVNGARRINPTDAMKIAGVTCDAAVKRGAASFSLEIAIPFAVLHLTPETKEVWGFNAARARFVERMKERGPNSMYSIWANTGGAFNRPARFGDLEIRRDFSDFFYAVKVSDRLAQGAKSIPVTVHNQTGTPRSVAVTLRLQRLDGKELAWRRNTGLNQDESKRIEFPHDVGAVDAGAALVVELREGDRLVYLGGTSRRERVRPPLKGELTRDELPDRDVIVFSRDYTETVYPTSLPRASEIVTELKLQACPGEYEPVTFSVHAPKREVAIELQVGDDFRGAAGRISRRWLDVRFVECNNHWFNPNEFQRTPLFLRPMPFKISANETICLPVIAPAGESTRFWLTAYIPEDAAPGRYVMPLKLHIDGKETSAMRVSLDVLPFKLSKPDIAFGFYQRADGLPPGKRTLDYQRLMFEDMARHGMTTVVMYLYPLRGSMEMSRPPYFGVIPTMEDFMKSGLGRTDIPTVVIGPQVYGGSVRNSLMAVGRERGWPDWLFYTIDEPGDDERIAQARKMCQRLKEQHPGIKLTTAIAKRGIEALGDLHDVWICSTSSIDEEMIAKALEMGQSLWAYNCRFSATSPEAERLLTGLYTWVTGIGGMFQWAYLDGPAKNRMGKPLGELVRGTGLSTWDLYEKDPDGVTWGYCRVWPGEVGPEPTVGWELRREGVDDYRCLKTLEQALAAAEKKGAAPAAIAKAKALLAQVRSLVKPDCFSNGPKDYYKYRYEWDFSPSLEPTDYAPLRRQIVSAIAELTKP